MSAMTSLKAFAAAAVLAAAGLAGVLPVNVYGDPPPWAPAHGWRKRHDPYYTGYSGRRWERDYGVVEGSCNRAAVGALVGGVVGGAAGSQIGKGSDRQVAIVIGTIAGAVIGARIGRDLDNADRACMGHALELAGDNQRVRWANPDTGTTYLLTPLKGSARNGHTCREFSLQTTRGGRNESGTGQACQTGDGAWQIVG